MTITLASAVPVLRIFDVAKAKEFYLDFLGFDLVWEHRFDDNAPLYAEVVRGGLRLHLSEHHGDACPGSSLLVDIRGIDAFREELIARDYPYARPGIEPTPWGSRQMQIADPFGNKLRFSEPDSV